MTRKQKKMLLRILAAAAGLVALSLLPLEGVPKLALYLTVYLLIGGDILRKACKGIGNRRFLDENFLMALATVGAFALAIFTGSGDYNEAIAVMLFYQTGELFQSLAVGKSRKNIAALMDIRPDSANIEENGALRQVDPDEVGVGSIIVVQPGEKIPLDGVVLSGTSSLDTAALTGESLPRTVRCGDAVVSGCVSMTGVLRIQTTREFGESTVSKILELVENASSRKSRSEAFISRFARVYTPAVCGAALALAVLPPVLLLLLGGDPGWTDWLYRALSFLVISCPCALVISIPLTFFAGIGGAGSAGILIKGSNYLEALSKVSCVVLDKTGTLTQGTFTVTSVVPVGTTREALLDLAAHAECASSHPISKGLRAACGAPIHRSRVTDIRESSGEGVLARVDGKAVAVGNGKLMDRVGSPYLPNGTPGTVIYVAIGGLFAGSIVISDTVKPTAKAAMDALRRQKIETVMLTGDSYETAQAAASRLGISRFRAQLLPGDKVMEVEGLLAAKQPETTLAFAGDGINDAPVLSRADIGIAMGAMGSDAAIEAADVVLMDDDPTQIPRAIRIARKCMAIVKQNVVFSLGVKFLFLALTALGFSNMWLAIFADVGVMVIAVCNAIRALNPAK